MRLADAEREIFALQVILRGIKQRALLCLNTNCFNAFINRVIFLKDAAIF